MSEKNIFEFEFNGRVVYKYSFRDNKDDGEVEVGLYPEVREEGEFSECFPEDWRHGKVAIEKWLESETGSSQGAGVCSCGKHKAMWAAKKGSVNLIEREIVVYEVIEE